MGDILRVYVVLGKILQLWQSAFAKIAVPKWPNIEQIIQQSGHTDGLSTDHRDSILLAIKIFLLQKISFKCFLILT